MLLLCCLVFLLLLLLLLLCCLVFLLLLTAALSSLFCWQSVEVPLILHIHGGGYIADMESIDREALGRYAHDVQVPILSGERSCCCSSSGLLSLLGDFSRRLRSFLF